MITPQQAIERLISNNELFYDEMTDLMRQIMSGQVPPEQIAAILTGLRIKVETVSEITAAASVMREFATKVPLENADDLVDIVGTGGDGAKTFNISTTSMFVAAAAGAKVANTAAAPFLHPAALPMSWNKWAPTSTSTPNRLPKASSKPASALCSRPTITAPCAMLPLSAVRSVSAASSIFWVR